MKDNTLPAATMQQNNVLLRVSYITKNVA